MFNINRSWALQKIKNKNQMLNITVLPTPITGIDRQYKEL